MTLENETQTDTEGDQDIASVMEDKNSAQNQNSKTNVQTNGIKAMIDQAMQSYEKLPMLEVVFDRFARVLSTNLRNFTSENVDIDIKEISSLRFGSYISTLPQPCLISVFKALEWGGFGLVIPDGNLIYGLIDVLFGGRKTPNPTKFEGRPFTIIEQGLVSQLTSLILEDLGSAFDPLSPSTFELDRIASNPSFASIARPGDSIILLKLQINIQDRGGGIDILIPYTTLEPIRSLLLQVFMGEKFGKDSEWEAYLEGQIYYTPTILEAVLNSKLANLQEIAALKVGSTIIMDNSPEDEILLHSNGVRLFSAKLGKVGNAIAVSIDGVFKKTDLEEKS